MTKSRNILRPRHTWTERELKLLKAYYPHQRGADVAELLGISLSVVYKQAKKLGLQKSEEFNQSDMSKRIMRGKSSEAMIRNRFQKGQPAWNKGIKGLQMGGVETQFKKGAKPLNHKPVGSTRICSKDGYVLIKVAEGKFQWKMLHRENWFKAHGSYPPPTHVLTFKDGNKLNCDVANLEMITKGEHVKRNGIHSYPPEVVQVMLLRGALNRRINNARKKEHEPQK